MKCVLSKILRYYELLAPSDGFEPIIIAEMILRPMNGIKLGIRPRFKGEKSVSEMRKFFE